MPEVLEGLPPQLAGSIGRTVSGPSARLGRQIGGGIVGTLIALAQILDLFINWVHVVVQRSTVP